MVRIRKQANMHSENTVRLRLKFPVRCVVPGRSNVYTGAEERSKPEADRNP
jgi:hypothetical protein